MERATTWYRGDMIFTAFEPRPVGVLVAFPQPVAIGRSPRLGTQVRSTGSDLALCSVRTCSPVCCRPLSAHLVSFSSTRRLWSVAPVVCACVIAIIVARSYREYDRERLENQNARRSQ